MLQSASNATFRLSCYETNPCHPSNVNMTQFLSKCKSKVTRNIQCSQKWAKCSKRFQICLKLLRSNPKVPRYLPRQGQYYDREKRIWDRTPRDNKDAWLLHVSVNLSLQLLKLLKLPYFLGKSQFYRLHHLCHVFYHTKLVTLLNYLKIWWSR